MKSPKEPLHFSLPNFLAALFLVLCCTWSAPGQGMLMFKKNKRRQAYYQIGDVISFRIKGDRKKITDVIRDFEDSLIVFRNYTINPKEITHLYVDEKTKVWYVLRYKYERLFLFAGGGYLLLDIFNTGELSHETAVIGGCLIGAGLLARLMINDAIRIKGKRRLYLLRK